MQLRRSGLHVQPDTPKRLSKHLSYIFFFNLSYFEAERCKLSADGVTVIVDIGP